MDEWIEFEGRVAPMVWGKSTYTILPIPPDVIDQLALGGGKRVELEINDQSFELALTKAPVLAETFVYTGKRILTATAVTPGELLSLRIRGSDPNKVDLSDDVRAMLIAGEVFGGMGGFITRQTPRPFTSDSNGQTDRDAADTHSTFVRLSGGHN